MEESKETSLVVKNDSFFARLKEFFRMFFGVDGKYTLKKENTIEPENNKVIQNDFNQIDQTDYDYELNLQKVLLELQEAYENNVIKEEDFTKNQLYDLKQLYINQINSLKNSIDEDERNILKLKEQIDKRNNNM